MNKRLIFSAIILKGASSIIAQTLLLRELLIIFYGNELTFGIILALWLASGALGSAVIGPMFKKSEIPLRPYVLFQVILSLWLPLAIIFIRTSKSLLAIPFAEVLNIGPIVVIALIALFAFSFSDAGLFNIGFRLISRTSGSEGKAMAKIYLLESLGIIAGGIAFTFILLSVFNSLQIAFLICGLNLLFALLLLSRDGNHFFKIGIGVLFLITLNFFSFSPALQKLTLALQWPKKNIVAYQNSVYGNIAVSKEFSQYTLFYDGLPAISVPSPETYFTEDFIHIPLLAQSGPEKILFIGNAVGGLLREALKYPVSSLVYVELDPLFVKVIQSLKEPTAESELKDPRVHIAFTDARSYLKTSHGQFDAVFVNTGLPTSLAINRYSTQEFFRQIQGVLKADGIAVFKTWGSLSYLSDELKVINASLLKTLTSVFPFCEVIPGDGFNIFIASQKKQDFDVNLMSGRLKELGLKTYLINPSYLGLRLSKPYSEWFYDNIKTSLAHASVNTDLKPTALYDGLSLYYAQFSKKIPKVFGGFKRVRPGHLTLALVILLIFARLSLPRSKAQTGSLSFTVLSTGLFAMSVQIIVLMLFQSLLGYLFQWLAILTMSFMAGTSLGAFYAIRNLNELSHYKKLGAMDILLPLATSALLLVTVTIFKNSGNFAPHIKWCLSLVSLCAGCLVGVEMPVIYNLYKKSTQPLKTSASKIAGQLYGLDLIGACAGALLAPIILIPSCGIILAALILCLLKILNGANILRLARKEG